MVTLCEDGDPLWGSVTKQYNLVPVLKPGLWNRLWNIVDCNSVINVSPLPSAHCRSRQLKRSWAPPVPYSLRHRAVTGWLDWASLIFLLSLARLNQNCWGNYAKISEGSVFLDSETWQICLPSFVNFDPIAEEINTKIRQRSLQC